MLTPTEIVLSALKDKVKQLKTEQQTLRGMGYIAKADRIASEQEQFEEVLNKFKKNSFQVWEA